MQSSPRYSAPLLQFRAAIARLRHNRSGIAAVEFALILPLMLLMYFGSAEITKGILVNRKVTIAAKTVSDLLGQWDGNMDDTGLDSIFAAGRAVMGSDATGLKMTLTNFKFVWHDATNTVLDAKPVWSVSKSGNTQRVCGVMTKDTSSTLYPDTTKVPAGFYSGLQTMVVADITYTYPSPFNINAPFYQSPSTLTFTRAVFNTPRSKTAANYTGASGLKCP